MASKTLDGESSAARQRELIDTALREVFAPSAAAVAGAAPDAAPSPPLPPPDLLPGYEILREIHRGGQGVIYEAVQHSTGRNVAIKVMREGPFAGPRDRAWFEREIHVLAQLRHPNIVTIHDTAETAGHFYYVMDYIAGRPLDVHMAGTDRSVPETLRLFLAICEAVNAAHLRGVIHRDLKPGNILVDDDGEPHLLDFGLAKITAGGSMDNGTDRSVTRTGEFVGSLPWASPEQAAGDSARIDMRSDVYSLGVTLYHMLTGRFPYPVAGNIHDVRDNILRAEPARPSTVRRRLGDEIGTIVLKSLSKEPQRRYQSAGELAADVRRYLAGEPIDAKRDSSWYLVRKTLRRHRVAIVIGTLVVAILAGGGMVSSAHLRRRRIERETALINAALNETMRSFGFGEKVSRDVEELQSALDRVAQGLDADLSSGTATEGNLRRMLGTIYAGIALYPQGEEQLRLAVAIHARELGEHHLETLRTKESLAAVLLSRWDLEEAEKLAREVYDVRRERLGPEDPRTLTAMHRLGMILHDRGGLTDAEALYRAALEQRQDALGEGDWDTLAVSRSLGLLLVETGDLDEAEALMRRVVETQRRLFGLRDHQTLSAINVLGGIMLERGELEEAERLFQESFDMREELLRPDHPSTLTSARNLGRALLAQGELEEAATLLRETIAVQEDILPERHPEPLRAREVLARVLLAQGALPEAEALFSQVAADAKAIYPEVHWRRALYEARYADCLRRAGNRPQAEVILLDAHRRLARALNTAHPRTREVAQLLATLYAEAGDVEQSALSAAQCRAPRHEGRLSTAWRRRGT